MRNHHFFLVLVLLLSTCTSSATPETVVPAVTVMPTDTLSPTSKATTPTATATPTNTLSPTPEITTPTVTVTPIDISGPRPIGTTPAVFATPPITTVGDILVAYGTSDVLTLARVDRKGNVWPVSEPRSMSGSFWDHPHLSSNGIWLAYYESGIQDKLILYNLQTQEKQIILVPVGAIATVPIFDRTSQRTAYVVIADLGTKVDDIYAWAIYVRDITTGTQTVFGGSALVEQNDEPLPGVRPVPKKLNQVLV
jgi:hypothetical protein